MTRRWRIASFSFTILLIAAMAWAGSFNCDYDGSKKGTVGKPNNLTIDMGTILWADGNSGKDVKVRWPMKYDHYNGTVLAGTWNKGDIVTPSGNFVVKLKVKLAGRKSWGFWSSKRNQVTVDVCKGDASGEVLATKSIDKNVGSPSETTIELPQVTAGLSSGNGQQYTIKLTYRKHDDDGGNDSWCGSVITVTAD